ncbi:MAG: hypothetical protein K2R93_12245 [Gemmatimonadaceae bacterium]|nr:hypothetical protein [Gemmatimonadaceae bacterium]
MSFRITALVINGRTYERRKGRSVNRWSYMPNNGHPRVWVHRESRLHHALERMALTEEQIQDMQARIGPVVAAAVEFTRLHDELSARSDLALGLAAKVNDAEGELHAAVRALAATTQGDG